VPPEPASDGGDGPDDRHVAAHRRVADLFGRRDRERVDDVDTDAALAELETSRREAGISGLVDESLRPFSADERRIADVLADEGYNVTALPPSTVPGQRTPDAAVGARRTEFKTLRTANPDTLGDRLVGSVGQAPIVVVDLRSSPLTEQQAVGVTRYALAEHPQLERVRFIGRNYDRLVER
jgi:hypothetical protein